MRKLIKQKQVWIVINLLILTMLASVKPLFSDPLRLYGEKVLFDVYHEGVQVGTHSVTFENLPIELRVSTRFQISIKFLFFEAYRFKYRSDAIWRNGHLDQITVDIDDDGEGFSFEGIGSGNSMSLDLPTGEKKIRIPIFPTNHWNVEVLNERQVLNTLTGEINTVEIILQGRELVVTENGKILATKYAYTGDLETEVWYDNAGRWVKMRFSAKDGSVIDYVCRRCQGETNKPSKL